MRILLVEDEMNMAAALTAALSRHDIVVDHARTLEIAEEACRSGVHDAVLLDRKLPDGDGLSLIPVLRRAYGDEAAVWNTSECGAVSATVDGDGRLSVIGFRAASEP